MKRRVFLEPDTETVDWAAWCPEFPRCASPGVTATEGRSNTREVIDLCVRPGPVELQPGTITREVIV